MDLFPGYLNGWAPLKEWSNVKIDGLKIGGYTVSLLDTEPIIMISQECIISLLQLSFWKIINSKLVDLCLQNKPANKWLLVYTSIDCKAIKTLDGVRQIDQIISILQGRDLGANITEPLFRFVSVN